MNIRSKNRKSQCDTNMTWKDWRLGLSKFLLFNYFQNCLMAIFFSFHLLTLQEMRPVFIWKKYFIILQQRLILFSLGCFAAHTRLIIKSCFCNSLHVVRGRWWSYRSYKTYMVMTPSLTFISSSTLVWMVTLPFYTLSFLHENGHQWKNYIH